MNDVDPFTIELRYGSRRRIRFGETGDQNGDYKKEAIVVQDASVSRTIDKDLRELGMDDVRIVRTGGVTE